VGLFSEVGIEDLRDTAPSGCSLADAGLLDDATSPGARTGTEAVPGGLRETMIARTAKACDFANRLIFWDRITLGHRDPHDSTRLSRTGGDPER
jgi:hypothetical protein